MVEHNTKLDDDATINPSVFGLLLFGFLLVVIGTPNFVSGGEGELIFALFIAGLERHLLVSGKSRADGHTSGT